MTLRYRLQAVKIGELFTNLHINIMKFLLILFKWLVPLLAILATVVWAFLHFHPAFGGKPDAASLKRIHASKAFNQTTNQFENLEPTTLLTSDKKPSVSGWLLKLITPEPGKNPSEPLPSVKPDQAALKKGSVAWFGHSTVLF